MHRVYDHWGNLIELTDERWDYVRYWHPDLAGHLEVLATIKMGRRRQDSLDPNQGSEKNGDN